MNLTTLDGIFVVAYFAGLLVFGTLVRRIRSFADYAVAERRVPAVMVFASLAAAYIGPGYTLGVCGKGADTGWLFYLTTLAFGAQTLLVGLLLAPRLQTYSHCHTVGEVMGAPLWAMDSGCDWRPFLFGVRWLRRDHGTCRGRIPEVDRRCSSISRSAPRNGRRSALHVHGRHQVGHCDPRVALQFSLFAVVVPFMLFTVASRESADITAASAAAATATITAAKALGPAQVVGLVVAFLLGETLIPPYVSRALAAGSPMIARKGFVFGALFSAAWGAIVTAIGIVGIRPSPPRRVTEPSWRSQRPHFSRTVCLASSSRP